MRRLALAPIAGILLLALVPGSVLALVPGDLDQSSLLIPNSVGSTADQAQTFTAGRTGFLDDVELYFNGSGTLTMTIQATTAGLPNGTVLATTTATLVSVDGWVDFVFASPASVTSGTMYAIVFNTGVAAAVRGTDVEDPDNYVPGRLLSGAPASGLPATSSATSPSGHTCASPRPRPRRRSTPTPTASVTPPSDLHRRAGLAGRLRPLAAAGGRFGDRLRNAAPGSGQKRACRI